MSAYGKSEKKVIVNLGCRPDAGSGVTRGENEIYWTHGTFPERKMHMREDENRKGAGKSHEE